MKLVEQKHNVVRSGTFAENAFKIAANAKAFDILSSKIYTDVPLAVVRELSTNAHDAHVAAGTTDQPFYVHLPNRLESWLEIRDYGTGLSPEDVTTIFTVYFASTRNTSDAFTGCLGLGSKSPFAYTDQFVVTSYLDGTMRVYSLFKNEEGAPSIALMMEQETEEPNGVSVKINVKQNDIVSFVRAASDVYRFFELRPTIVGAHLNFDHTPLLETEYYQVFKDTFTLPKKINVVMGQVCYGVNKSPSRLGSDISLVVYMDIGDCSVAASREELHQDKRTQANVERAVNDAIEDITAKLKAEEERAPTELLRYMQKHRNANIVYIDGNTARYASSMQGCKLGKYDLRKLNIHRNRLTYEDVSTINVRSDVSYLFIEDDVSNSGSPKWRRHIRYWLEHTKSSVCAFLVRIQDREAFLKTFGETHGKVSELPTPPKKTSDRKTLSRQYIKELTITNKWKSVQNVVTDKSLTYAIVPRHHNNIISPNGSNVHPNMARRIAKLVGVQVIYGITKSQFAKFRQTSGLPCLFDMGKQWVIKEVAQMDEVDHAIFNGHANTTIPKDWLGKIAGLSPVCDRLHKAAERKPIGEIFRFLVRTFEVDIPKVEGYDKAFLERYPLVKYLPRYAFQDNSLLNHLVEYITLKEQAHV